SLTDVKQRLEFSKPQLSYHSWIFQQLYALANFGAGQLQQLRCAAIVVHPQRSEEHTSELQSLAYLVCRLLLEKKKSEIFLICFRKRFRVWFIRQLLPDPKRVPQSLVAAGPLTPGRFGLRFFFNDTATTEIYTLSLHDALPI